MVNCIESGLIRRRGDDSRRRSPSDDAFRLSVDGQSTILLALFGAESREIDYDKCTLTGQLKCVSTEEDGHY